VSVYFVKLLCIKLRECEEANKQETDLRIGGNFILNISVRWSSKPGVSTTNYIYLVEKK